MERELITGHQANLLMIAVLVLAPVIGLAWGWSVNRRRQGAILGFLVGGGNFALWTVYNKITDHLGLDTVKNLLVNLALFSLLGILAGWTAARCGTEARKGKQ